ncbi:hypothetical protein GCM10025867_51620 (plasmid) [Frondihabitans sucicola]|uniref:Uncharacterized protein n=1 Tax=Frondihabitans sucicola TaxID=1268041 RepID=A0ABM8GV64_9MICO|nr:hypothetical protein [Frondihabitans sucicola]BDZ52354.1 hypothetical protein GCM10025867_45950 [Frondihabitans sucicola]BDZ52921.1 hypothetical protein GCM10025867_51620 [Frondihabitans sucicola]
MKLNQMRRDAIYALRDTGYTYRPSGECVLETRALIPLDLTNPGTVRRDVFDPTEPVQIYLGGSRLGNSYLGFVGDFEVIRQHADRLRSLSLAEFTFPGAIYDESDLPEGVTLCHFEAKKVTGLWEDWAPIGEEIEAERDRVAALDVARVSRDTLLRDSIHQVMADLNIEDNGRSGVSVNVERGEVRMNVGTLALLLGLDPVPLTDDELRRAGQNVPERPSLKGAIRGQGHGNVTPTVLEG